MQRKQSTYEQVLDHLLAHEYEEVLQIIETWGNQHLAVFLLHNPEILYLMRQEFFNEFWTKRLHALRVSSQPDFRFMEQPGIKNGDLVIGYLFYLLELSPNSLSLHSMDGKSTFRETDFLSFHLVRLRLHFLFLKMKEPQGDDLVKFMHTLSHLEAFAKLYGTPGYLLLVNGYAQLARSLQKLNLIEQCMEAFKLCWKFLHLSELAEQDSVEAINNAYFGMGLILSTPFELASIAEMKAYCLSYAGPLLPLSHQKSAEYAAELTYQNVLKIRKKELAVEDI